VQVRQLAFPNALPSKEQLLTAHPSYELQAAVARPLPRLEESSEVLPMSSDKRYKLSTLACEPLKSRSAMRGLRWEWLLEGRTLFL
jgi:hypothetical protein